MQLGVERLQVELLSANSRRLDKIVALSGKTKIEIINYLILSADLSDFGVVSPIDYVAPTVNPLIL